VETRLHLPRSQFWRRLLWASGPIVLAVGVLVFLVAHYRNVSGNGTLPALPNAPVSNNVDQSLSDAARRTAAKFILTAVVGRNVGESFNLVAPSFKQQWWACNKCDKQEWIRGPIPIVPAGFPVKDMSQVRFHVKDRTGENAMTIEVVLISDKGRAEPFNLGLRRASKTKPWLVDYWMSAYVAGFRANPAAG
jgi:hypothetical protein